MYSQQLSIFVVPLREIKPLAILWQIHSLVKPNFGLAGSGS